jgi:2-polyprenyl-3-methyl-5-hydroxy-6-metoxy-1,4-benzoquinol methylase
MIKTKWSKAQVEDLIKHENLAYQRIELPYGLMTAGEDRSSTSAKIFADGIQGKSVLDIGCYLGYFCYEAVRAGASRVVGIDVDENRLRQAKLIADCLGSDINLELFDVEEQELTEKFDIILMLNVLHHFRNPISVIDKVIPHTKERLILEVAGPSSPRPTKLLKSIGASWWTRRRLQYLPLIVVGRNWAVQKGNEQKFFFTPTALKHLLTEQRLSFSRLDIKSSSFKNRYICVAWKRQIGHLIVIGGTSSSGKSTLIERLIRAELTEISNEIGMDLSQNWTYSDASRIRNIKAEKVQNMVYHYDILRVINSDTYTYSREQGTDVFSCSDRCTVVTIWCDPAVMCQRKQLEIRDGMRHWRRRRIRNTLALYQDADRLSQLYKKWIAFCREKGAQLFFVDCTSDPCLMTYSQWNEKLTRLSNT